MAKSGISGLLFVDWRILGCKPQLGWKKGNPEIVHWSNVFADLTDHI